MRQGAVSFKVEGLNFEGVIAWPEGNAGPLPGVVVCHPHPLYGGNMDNNVVLSISFALASRGLAALRFNFRGAGNSQGEHGHGELEQQEVLAAMDLLRGRPEVDSGRLGLAGYSFGSSVILNSPDLHDEAKAFALISPPLQALEATALKKSKGPALVIAGDQDKLAQSDRFAAVLDSFSHPPDCHVVPGADHYWSGQEDLLSERVVEFFVKALA